MNCEEHVSTIEFLTTDSMMFETDLFFGPSSTEVCQKPKTQLGDVKYEEAWKRLRFKR